MGGLTKEWFLLLIKQIFSSDYGMFVYHNQARCYWFSTAQLGNLREYNLIGVLMGLAVYNSIILDLNFPTACYKKLLSPPVVPSNMDSSNVGNCKFTLEDLSEVMPDVVVGLRELLSYEGNVEEDFLMHFEASVEEFGEVKTHVLKEGGEHVAVTNENRQGSLIARMIDGDKRSERYFVAFSNQPLATCGTTLQSTWSCTWI